jgi:hypothetical protein
MAKLNFSQLAVFHLLDNIWIDDMEDASNA